MCTSLIYTDTAGRPYLGRTLELTTDLPYHLVYFPAQTAFHSQLKDTAPVDYASQYAVLGVTMPGRIPTADAPITLGDLKVLEGMNDQGLTFSLLSYPAAGGKSASLAATQAILSASDLGTWALGQFASVDEVKAALDAQPVALEPLALLGGVESPFHYIVHDSAGRSLVIEFDNGAMITYDNPIGVMTNGPRFDWHLVNMNNYTFLSNVDQSSAMFGGYKAMQPDSGIATAALPASNTSVGRFVRAAFYAQFTEKAQDADKAVLALSHIMNNFDRPRGVTIDYPGEDGGHLEVPGLSADTTTEYATEYTCWTNLSDLTRKRFYLRTYGRLNYASFDLAALAHCDGPRVLPVAALDGMGGDSTAMLQHGAAL